MPNDLRLKYLGTTIRYALANFEDAARLESMFYLLATQQKQAKEGGA